MNKKGAKRKPKIKKSQKKKPLNKKQLNELKIRGQKKTAKKERVKEKPKTLKKGRRKRKGIMNNKFGSFIELKRKEKAKMTLRAFAESIGIAPAYLSDIENGNRKPPEGEVLEKILNKLCLTLDERKIAYDMVGEIREEVAPDIPKYVLENDHVKAALREARDGEASVEDWLEFIEMIKNKRR